MPEVPAYVSSGVPMTPEERLIRDAIAAAREEGRREEREACAKIAAEWNDTDYVGESIAEEIRARGKA